ncbi:helix-turn-helix domain-containing protein [Cognatishimia activa]|nr:helix-turn-helix domain-containing protein [Cognatishimia activa]
MKRVPKSPLRDRLATNLRVERAKLGWSQERLAQEASLNRTYLSAIERSEQNISIDNLWRLSQALQIPAEVLLTSRAADK